MQVILAFHEWPTNLVQHNKSSCTASNLSADIFTCNKHIFTRYWLIISLWILDFQEKSAYLSLALMHMCDSA